MKKFTFKGVLDGFRQTVQPQAIRQEQEILEQLKPEHFTLKKVSEKTTKMKLDENNDCIVYMCYVCYICILSTFNIKRQRVSKRKLCKINDIKYQ